MRRRTTTIPLSRMIFFASNAFIPELITQNSEHTLIPFITELKHILLFILRRAQRQAELSEHEDGFQPDPKSAIVDLPSRCL